MAKKKQARLDLYKTPIRYRPMWTGDKTKLEEFFLQCGRPMPSGPTEFWHLTKELIFCQKPTPTLTLVTYLLDMDTLELVLTPAVETVEADEDSLRYHLAMAVGNEIPVYPNTVEDAPYLEAIYEGIVEHGFSRTVDGKKERFTFSDKFTPPSTRANPGDYLVPDRLQNPVELMVIRRRINARLAELSSAQTTLDRIDLAMRELEVALKEPGRNERKLQRCLTSHPVLFGPDYRRVIPQHQLGGEFVMDYALQRHSGLVDLVEIESSTLELFTKGKDPQTRKELVHAEQQVYDWLEWMEQHGHYAREKLSVHRPRGIIVIGRSASLTRRYAKKLRQRNRILADVLEIFTFDQLLERTRSLRRLLTGTSSA